VLGAEQHSYPGRVREHLTRVLFYGAVLLLLVSTVTGLLAALLPEDVATSGAHNSEGYVILLGVAAWIEFVRPRIPPGAWRVTAAASGTSLAVALVLLLAGLPTPLATLNEAFFALAVLIPWLQLPRPVPRPAFALPLVAAAVPVVLHGDAAVVRADEVLAAFVLFPIALDLVDRGILDPRQPRRLPLVVAWLAGIVVVVLAAHLLRTPAPQGPGQDLVDFLSRVNEVFIAVFFVHVYFTVLGMAPGRTRGSLPVPAERPVT
jgi:hypothetical protein